jgi:hypothetical protein
VPKQEFRFAVTLTEGPNAGLTSGGLRVWVHRESTYVTSRELGSTWKVSLHGDEAWRLAATSEQYRSERPVFAGRNRALWTFDPVPFVDGRRLAFAVAVTRGALLPQPLHPKDHQIATDDRWDQLTIGLIWMTEPGVTFEDPSRIGGPLVLDSGRRVWITQSIDYLGGGAPEAQCEGIVVEPMWPGRHDVTAPGLILKGVRWDDDGTAHPEEPGTLADEPSGILATPMRLPAAPPGR